MVYEEFTGKTCEYLYFKEFTEKHDDILCDCVPMMYRYILLLKCRHVDQTCSFLVQKIEGSRFEVRALQARLSDLLRSHQNHQF